MLKNSNNSFYEFYRICSCSSKPTLSPSSAFNRDGWLALIKDIENKRKEGK